MKTDLETHLKNNVSCEDYELSTRNRYIIDHANGYKINIDKAPESLLNIVKENMQIAEEIISNRLKNDKPQIGDFILVNNKHYYRIALNLTEGNFQYSKEQQFYQGGNFSGSLDIDYGTTLAYKDLKPTGELKEGLFWFFSRNSYNGKKGNGVYCTGNFRVWKIKAKKY